MILGSIFSMAPQRLERRDRLGPRLEPVEAAVGLGHEVVHAAVRRHDVERHEAVAQADRVVVEIVGGGDLHGPGPLLGIGVLVGDDRDVAAGQRQRQLAADEVAVARVLGVDRHGLIAEQRLGPGRRHHDVALRLVGERVADEPEVALDLPRLDFEVGDRGAELRVPVDEARAAVDEPVAVERDEDPHHGAADHGVEGEALARPVGRAAEAAQLRLDGPRRLLAPGVGAFEKRLAPQREARLAGLGELALDDEMRRDAGVVGAGQPEHVVAALALVAHHHVLQRHVERVADVELARDVGGRHDHRELRPRRRHVGAAHAGLEPTVDELRLDRLGAQNGRECSTCQRSSWNSGPGTHGPHGLLPGPARGVDPGLNRSRREAQPASMGSRRSAERTVEIGSGVRLDAQVTASRWCPGADSNHRHCDFQSHALPTELPGPLVTPRGRD